MKSTLRNMVLSLTGITVFAALGLGAVNLLTKEPIAEASRAARNAALEAVLPPFDNISATADTLPEGLVVFHATNGGVPSGTAVQTFSDAGFSGRITLLAGFDNSGALTGYRVLQHAETPGLGARMEEWFSTEPHAVVGATESLQVKADGGDIDAITGATITSRAFLEAINKARKAL